MLEQKATNTNARVRIQEALIVSLGKAGAILDTDDFDETRIPKNVQFLRDMMQQVRAALIMILAKKMSPCLLDIDTGGMLQFTSA